MFAYGQDFGYDLFFLLHDVARLIRVEADKRARTHGMTRAQWGCYYGSPAIPASAKRKPPICWK